MSAQYNIDDLITKYLCGEASTEEAIIIEEWKSDSKDNSNHFDAMEQSFHLVYNTAPANPNKALAWERLNNKIEKKSSNTRWIYGLVAACFAVVVGATFLMRQNETLNIVASNTAIQKVLKDNSEINLQPNSEITLSEGFGKTNRRMKFTGNASFKVKHDDKLPFIIESQGVFIEDLGTAFTVKSEPTNDTIYVVVNEGIVRLYDEGGNEITIKAGEKAWYIKSKKQIISDHETKVIKFDFKDTRLADAVKLIEDTYEVSIKLSPSSIGDCTITTQFFDEELATIITVLTETLGFQYEYKQNTYKIIGKPCQ